MCPWLSGVSHAIAGKRGGARGEEPEREPAFPGEALHCARDSQSLLYGPSMRWGIRLLFPQLILEALAQPATAAHPSPPWLPLTPPLLSKSEDGLTWIPATANAGPQGAILFKLGKCLSSFMLFPSLENCCNIPILLGKAKDCYLSKCKNIQCKQ